jgi:uncharacterized protein YcbK (DUF882 family)
MGDLTKNISAHELRCKCGICKVRIQDHEPVIQVVQGACDHFAKKSGKRVTVVITSAARCYGYNRMPVHMGGAGSNDESQHPRCCAMDIKILIDGVQVDPDFVAEYFDEKYPDTYGIGNYKSFTHIDTRAIKARW